MLSFKIAGNSSSSMSRTVGLSYRASKYADVSRLSSMSVVISFCIVSVSASHPCISILSVSINILLLCMIGLSFIMMYDTYCGVAYLSLTSFCFSR